MLLGHTCVCAVEIEPYCREILLQRQRDGILPKFPIWDDVRTFDGRPWRGKIDIICGGFPCQDISCAGKGAGIDGERSGLWSEFARIISEVRPRYAFVENSPMLAVRGLGQVLGDLSEIGYDAEWFVMGADDVGAPHIRKRMWILANSRRWSGRGDFGRESRRLRCGQAEEVGERNSNKAVRPSAAPETLADAEVPRFADGASGQRQEQSGGSRAWWDRDPADQDGAFESQLGRVADGVANRVDRLKAIGNGQVPLVAARVFKLLMERAQ